MTEERLREALLEIRGEIPTMAGLSAQLEVGVATLYNHVRGQEALRKLAGDVAFDAWALPDVKPGMHWAAWAFEYARGARALTLMYPAVTGARALAGGQLRYVDRVLKQFVAFGFEPADALAAFHALALLVLGVGAQLAATRVEEVRSGQTGWELFQQAITEQPEPLDVLGNLSQVALPDQDEAFDELVWFTLAGLARKRGEVLPARP